MNKNIINVLAGASLLMGCVLPSFAIPAKKGIVTVTQPDGTTVQVQKVGDEFAHMYLSADGLPLVLDNDFFYYATIDADGIVTATSVRATDPANRTPETKAMLAGADASLVPVALDRTARLGGKRSVAAAMRVPTRSRAMHAPKGPGLVPHANFPVTGSPRVLVVLVEYTDIKFSLENPLDYFSRMMNEPGFSSYGGTGSALDYFTESSCGQFTPQIDVYGPIQLPKNRAYYGANSSSGDDIRAYQMAIDACDILSETVDLAIYDTNNDDEIDNVFIFYAGVGEATSQVASSVWPHAWLVHDGANQTCIYNGKMLNRYACSNEWETGRPDGVGTFVHEFSHVMGLPDLYATNYNSSFTPGEWSALDTGPYNNNGCTPPLYTAFERYSMGWIEPIVLDGPVDGTLPSIGNNVCAIIPTPNANEYFLLENRQQVSWDKYIPGHGMLIWHIDYQADPWTGNTVNNNPTHQCVDIEEADNSRSEYTRAGDAFPGTSGITSFTSQTNPALRTWAGVNIDMPVTDIAETNGIITFKVAGGGEVINPAAPVGLPATDIGINSFTANWEAEEGCSYLLSVYTTLLGGYRQYVDGYRERSMGDTTSCLVEGLEWDTEYFYVLTATRGFGRSQESVPVAVTTDRPGIHQYAVETLPASDVDEDSFVAMWESLPEAVEYFVTVNDITKGAPLVDDCNFDDNLLPDGWVRSAGNWNAMASRVGKSQPSLTFNAPNNFIASCEYPDGVWRVSFWHIAQTSAKGTLLVEAYTGGEWTAVKEFDLYSTSGGITNSTDVPDGTSAARISFKRTSTSGSCYIDDIAVEHGASIERSPMGAYTEASAGASTSMLVEGLEAGRTYSYTVQATDGERRSKVSREIFVTTGGGNSGIDNVLPAGCRIETTGGSIAVSGIASDTTVAVFDLAGRTIATATGNCTVAVSAAGIYLVRVGSATVKCAVRSF